MIKTELHTHTADDPRDLIPHSTTDLIDRAAALGFGALAVTLHDRQLDLRPLAGYAAERGVVLINGIERTIEGRHVLLLNFPAAAEDVRGFEDVAALREAWPSGLVVAPHPFFPSRTCLRGLMDPHAALFDAVELNYFYTRDVDYNRPAVRWAARHGLPVVGNADCHRLYQLGRTYSLVDAEPNADAVCAAIREGRVEVRSEPIPMAEAASHFTELCRASLVKAWREFRPAGEPEPA